MTGTALLAPLAGRWRSEMQFPGQTLLGEASFAWLQEGGLLLMRSHTLDADLPPAAVAVICYDDGADRWSMGYHDERGVSRIYAMTFDGRAWTLQGKPKDFHQRFEATIEADWIDGVWEKSDDGDRWSEDFRIVYRRLGD